MTTNLSLYKDYDYDTQVMIAKIVLSPPQIPYDKTDDSLKYRVTHTKLLTKLSKSDRHKVINQLYTNFEKEI